MDQLKAIKETIHNMYWSLLVQGILFLLLAVLILLYPALLFALVSATFLLIGVVLLMLAWKIRKFWNKLPNILK